MRKIFSLAPKPSDAVYAMVAGLKKARTQQYVDFRIDMSTFGKLDYSKAVDGVICMGCAATCTLFELNKAQLLPGEIETSTRRSEAMRVESDELRVFENMIDHLRQARVSDMVYTYKYRNLISFTDILEGADYNPDEDLPVLNGDYTLEELEPYTRYADKLKSIGI